MHRAPVLLCALFAVACDSPGPQPAPERTSVPVEKAKEPAVPAMSNRSKPAPRELNETERALAGTWVAKVGADAPRSSAMEGMVMFGTEPGQDLVPGVMKAIEDDTRLSAACVWLELYDNLHGFRNECALIGGEPQALNSNDPFTGAAKPFGVGFTWRFEDKLLVIDYEEPLVVADGRRFSRELIELKPGSGPVHEVTQRFPQLEDIAPRTVRFEIFSGGYVGG